MNKLKTLQVIHLGFCAAPSFFVIIALLLNKESMNFDFSNASQQPILFIAPIFAVVLIVISGVVVKSFLNKAINEQGLAVASKFVQYQTAFIIKAAFLESAALFNAVGFLITGNLLLLAFALLAVIFIWMSRPTKDKISEDLRLEYPETLDEA